jgi:16S rRNA (cytidine1402-2'-O)-methyltransferase
MCARPRHAACLAPVGIPSQRHEQMADTASPGVLHVIATPIGNLADLSPRARAALAEADVVLAEDTRHTGVLLQRLGLHKPLLSLHEHNEEARVERVLDLLRGGARVALVSDAGTPLVSDPGYRLLAAVREHGLVASPVPGPSAVLAALSVAGLPTDRFVFEGFLPARASARAPRLAALRDEPRTFVLFEAGRRLPALLADLARVVGPDRRATVARELTKIHEEIVHGTVAALEAHVREHATGTRGEIVVVVEGAGARAAGASLADEDGVLGALLEDLPLGRAVSLAARVTGASRNALYRRALALRAGTGGNGGD